MLESVHCPKCAAHYALRPPRVLQRHRRAKCFTCDHIFPIGEEIRRLFASDELGSATVGFDADVLAVHTVSTTGIADEDIRSVQVTEAHPFLEMHAAPEATATAEGPLDLSFATSTHSGGPLTDLPHLSLSDLDEPDSAMEKTLILPPGAHPDLHPEHRLQGDIRTHGDDELEALGLAPATDHRAPQPAPSQPGADDSSPSYSSARDAIEKLMAGTPSVQRVRPASMSRGGGGMDVEGTLDALEATLSGTPTHSATMPILPPAEESSTVVLSTKELDQAMTAQTLEPEPSASTRMMHIDDMPLADASHMERTLRMPLPALTPPSPSLAGGMTTPIPMAAPPPAMEAVKDPNLLKVQLEGEVLSNVGMDQLIQMVEQGRVREFHMVARQFSENWLEATKVPALRPVFERMRRVTQIGPAPTMPSETAPVKKSLFGGLFGGKT